MFDWKKYFVVLLITVGIFTAAWYASSYANRRKIAQIHEMQNKLSTDILSSETQFALLAETSCDNIDDSSLSNELGVLADKLSYTEEHLEDKDELTLLKNQYAILQVKDFLLNKRIADKCKTNTTTILYFYTDKDHCDDCVKQSYVLDAIRDKYKVVRVYSFDYNLDLSTVKALRTIYKIGDTLPAIVIDGTTYNGFQSLDAVERNLPQRVTNPPKTKAVVKK